jgi:hypothetical protein
VDIVRRLLAVSLLVATLVVGVLSQTIDDWAVCHQEIARSDPVSVDVCRPLNLSDVPIALGIGLGLLFLLPDVRRVSVAGILELETKVKNQADRQDVLERQIQMISSQTQSMRSKVEVYVGQTLPPSADVPAAVESLESMADAFLDDTSEHADDARSDQAE